MTFYIVPIVEGETEVRCIERLLQRVWNELLNMPVRLQVLPASRGKRDALLDPKFPDLATKIEEAYAKLAAGLRRDPTARGLLLLLLDAEDACPAQLGPKLLDAAKKVRSDCPIACVLAKKMFENWIVAGASTLGNVNDLPEALPTRDRFEDRGGAAWLDTQLRSRDRARKYAKTGDAEAFVAKMDLRECRSNAPSFDKLCRELEIHTSKPSESTESPV